MGKEAHAKPYTAASQRCTPGALALPQGRPEESRVANDPVLRRREIPAPSGFFFPNERTCVKWWPSCSHAHAHTRTHGLARVLPHLRPGFPILLQTDRLAEGHRSKPPMSRTLTFLWGFTSRARWGTATAAGCLGCFSTVGVPRGAFWAAPRLLAGSGSTRARGRPGNERRGHLGPAGPPPARPPGKGAARAAGTRTVTGPPAKSDILQFGTTLVWG